MLFMSPPAFFLLAFDVFVTCYFVDENMDHLSICEHVFVSELKDKLYETFKTYCITAITPKS